MLDREAKTGLARPAATLPASVDLSPVKGLGTARGVVIGGLISIALWGGLLAWWLWG